MTTALGTKGIRAHFTAHNHGLRRAAGKYLLAALLVQAASIDRACAEASSLLQRQPPRHWSTLELEDVGSFLGSLYFRECVRRDMVGACKAITENVVAAARVNESARARAHEKLGELYELRGNDCAALIEYKNSLRIQEKEPLRRRVSLIADGLKTACVEPPGHNASGHPKSWAPPFQQSAISADWVTRVRWKNLPKIATIKAVNEAGFAVRAKQLEVEVVEPVGTESSTAWPYKAASAAEDVSTFQEEQNSKTNSNHNMAVPPIGCENLQASAITGCNPIATGAIPSFAPPNFITITDAHDQGDMFSAFTLSIAAMALMLISAHLWRQASHRYAPALRSIKIRQAAAPRYATTSRAESEDQTTKISSTFIEKRIEHASTNDVTQHDEPLSEETMASEGLDGLAEDATSEPTVDLALRLLVPGASSLDYLLILDGEGLISDALKHMHSEGISEVCGTPFILLSEQTPAATGILNPFKTCERFDDALLRQKLLAEQIDLHSWIFEAMFGSKMVAENRNTFRHFSQLLMRLPNASFQTWRKLLTEEELTLLPAYAYMVDIGETGLFFSEALKDKGFIEFTKRIERVISGCLQNAVFAHLTLPAAGTKTIQEFTDRGALIVLSSEIATIGERNGWALSRMFLAQAGQLRCSIDVQSVRLRKSSLLALQPSKMAGETWDDIEVKLKNVIKQNCGLELRPQIIASPAR